MSRTNVRAIVLFIGSGLLHVDLGLVLGAKVFGTHVYWTPLLQTVGVLAVVAVALLLTALTMTDALTSAEERA